MVSCVLAESIYNVLLLVQIAIWLHVQTEPALLFAKLTCFRCSWHREQLRIEFMVKGQAANVTQVQIYMQDAKIQNNYLATQQQNNKSFFFPQYLTAFCSVAFLTKTG